jgi:hypothetical protein
LVAETPDSVWPALVASVAPIAVGAFTIHFRLFIESNSEFRNRVNFHRAKLTEQFAGKLAAVLKHSKSMTADDVLRGDGREQPDLVGDVAKECYKLTTVLHRMEVIRIIVRFAYSMIFAAIAVGLIGVCVAWLWADSRPFVIWAGMGLVLFQGIIVLGVMRASSVLEVYEDVS